MTRYCRLFCRYWPLETGESYIKKLIISLLVIGAIACGAVYMALTSGPVVVKKADTTPAARPLAYEQQINRPDNSAPAPADSAPEQQAPAALVEADQTAASNEDASNDDPSQIAAPPHNGEVTISEPGALPWQKPDPAMQGEGPDGSGPGAQGEDVYPSDPMAAGPGQDADPNAYPAGPRGRATRMGAGARVGCRHARRRVGRCARAIRLPLWPHFAGGVAL